MFTGIFWKKAFERSVKTFAQAGAALLVGDGLGVLTVDWGNVFSVAGLAAVASFLTSVASLPVGEQDSPSLVEE